MKFQQYTKGRKTINATETAYNAIYKGMGFIPKAEVATNEGTEGADPGGSDSKDSGDDTATGKSKKSKS